MATSDPAAPPSYSQEPGPSVPLLPQGGYPPQAGYPPQGYPPQGYPQQPGQPMYPQMNQPYQPVANEKQQYGYPNVQQAYQPTTVQPGQQVPPGTNVIIVGTANQADPRVHSINDLLGLSIFTTVCCNLLFGIIAIVYSIRVRDAKRNNDYHAAKSAYKVMLAMNITGIVLSAVLIIVSVVLYVTTVVMVTNSLSSYSMNMNQQ